MSYSCPVCNGFWSSGACCPSCGAAAEDFGRFNDTLGPYSPYRSIEEIGRTNGFTDLSRHVCIHIMSCPSCRQTFTTEIGEWPL